MSGKDALIRRICTGESLLMQEMVHRYVHDQALRAYAWSQLVGPIMQARCQRKTAHTVFFKFMDIFGTAERFSTYDMRVSTSVVDRAINGLDCLTGFLSLGLAKSRYRSIRSAADHIIQKGPPRNREEVLEIEGAGDYIADSYELFVLHSWDEHRSKIRDKDSDPAMLPSNAPNDQMLRAYMQSKRFIDRGARTTIYL